MPVGPRPEPVVDEPFGSAPPQLRLSIVVVAWRTDGGIAGGVERLSALLPADVEVLLVGNAVDLRPAAVPLIDAGRNGRVLQLANNEGPSPARNVAADRAAAPVIAFLDDDARIEPGWVDALLTGIERDGIVAVRGRVVADRRPWLTRLARAYDLGPAPCPAVLNTEGNMAVEAEAFRAVGGFAGLFGHEGVELSARLQERFGGKSIGYEPGAVIRHDYVRSIPAYLAKRFRHGRNLQHLQASDIRRAAAIRPPRTAWDLLLAPLRFLGSGAEVAGAAWQVVGRVVRR